MNLYKITIAAVLFCVPCHAETIRGKVADRLNQPLSAVSILGAGTDVQTDSAGQFAIEIPVNGAELTLTKEGFQKLRVHAAWAENPLALVMDVAPQRSEITVTSASGYLETDISSGTRTLTKLRDIPQSISIVTSRQMTDQLMTSVADAVRYVPGVTSIQGENNRDQLVIRGNSTSADFFLDGVRDDVQYYRDVYDLDRLEVLKGPNAMVFGRGGGGGVVNRVTKEAGFTPLRELTVTGGSFGNRRFAADFDQPLGGKTAIRMNAVYEDSDSFRRFVNLERYGLAPTFTLRISERTRLELSYELFHDGRTADRGVPSFGGRPLKIGSDTYFGNPDQSRVHFTGNAGGLTAEHEAESFRVKTRFRVADYDRFYQNFVPGAVTADRLQDLLSAYNNSTARRNLFSQTDLTKPATTGLVRHTLLMGVELGRQNTNNFRNTGYFGNLSTVLPVRLSNTVLSSPVTFRQSATDADNHLLANIAAGYIQDQMELTRRIQFLAGLRFDYFDLQYANNRNLDRLRRIDHLISPRAGVVIKPVDSLSIYASVSVSYLPSSGDQFSSLTMVTQQVKPEMFRNYEVGTKWDVRPGLSLTAAIFRLDRTNTRSTDPSDVTRIVQTGSQRTNGVEVGWTGSVTRRWSVAGGAGLEDAYISRATISARAGAHVAQAPHGTFSLWNRYQLSPRLGAGVGVVNRGDMFAAIDNTVVLPGFTRADAAVFFNISEKLRFQANVENLFDRKYTLNADNNNNISPGSPRAVRVGLTARF